MISYEDDFFYLNDLWKCHLSNMIEEEKNFSNFFMVKYTYKKDTDIKIFPANQGIATVIIVLSNYSMQYTVEKKNWRDMTVKNHIYLPKVRKILIRPMVSHQPFCNMAKYLQEILKRVIYKIEINLTNKKNIWNKLENASFEANDIPIN